MNQFSMNYDGLRVDIATPFSTARSARARFPVAFTLSGRYTPERTSMNVGESTLDSPAEVPVARPAGQAELLATAARLAAVAGLVERFPADAEQRTWLPLDAGPGAEAWLIAWPPGTGTGWHDHGGAAGAMVAVAGALTERSIDAPADHDYGRALPLPGGTGRVRVLSAGRGRAFSARHIHEVTNDGTVTAYSVHVYAPSLPLMRHYAPDGETLVLVGAETQADW
jgi:predicted metal-dependent enzyme (double-stranded beta helix superfamily)